MTRLNLIWDDCDMPARNTVKTYTENTYYHIYNRGVEGRDIYADEQDYKVFLGFIKRYLTVPIQNEVQPQNGAQRKANLYDELQLAAYCLMPNHFHLLLKQHRIDSTTKFIRALMNCYVRYFNQKYKRIGGLFQGIFKAVPIDNEAYLLHLTRYIHLNPLELHDMTMERLEDYYCSYGEYIGKRTTSWINSKEILGYFGSNLINIGSFDSYRHFVEKYTGNSSEVLGMMTLE